MLVPAGCFIKELKLGYVIVAKDAYSESVYAKDVGLKVPKSKILKASESTLTKCLNVAKVLKLKPHVGKVLCEDAFYSDIP